MTEEQELLDFMKESGERVRESEKKINQCEKEIEVLNEQIWSLPNIDERSKEVKMFMQIEIKDGIKKCPQCSKPIEWTSNKIDKTEEELICKNCRIFVKLIGMSEEDQEIIAEEAFA